MTPKISFDAFQEKRKRPREICFDCGKYKEIYTHAAEDSNKPLCSGCNMKRRRNSSGAMQVRLLKLCAATLGTVESMLGLPVEEHKDTLESVQDDLKTMMRALLDDRRAGVEEDDATETEQSADLPDPPSETQRAAVSEENDAFFEPRKAENATTPD